MAKRDPRFSGRLKRAMKARDMTKIDLARAIGATPSTLTAYYNGRIPEAPILYKIARALGVTMEYLLTGKGKKKG